MFRLPAATRASISPISRPSFSWGETSEAQLQGGERTQLDEGVDTRGPVTLGAAVVAGGAQEGEVEQEPAEEGEPSDTDGESDRADDAMKAPETRLLLFGDSDFPSNTYFQLAGNGDLVLSGIAWLAEQGELVSIRPKTTTPRRPCRVTRSRRSPRIDILPRENDSALILQLRPIWASSLSSTYLATISEPSWMITPLPIAAPASR